ncbi:type II toxin-antitoxin system PemK/MazF family toxin [Bifidobacterium sp. ESL0800]|uniref:type II toxin-antitoxin system PemK/MazF family toxin n=1 Tax=Bifidobacterium sp. ESL0800 TaxID=2983236 RepID=UPI0023F92E98|nr:type II toxin-antitoxin system PemK/MazF family toxin [Bifidobacterium sp. ESL0800]WEV76107.1 type II toxin-antitoxin system PemK/MazF family toxin [Bifidobacterium sp. ESL0800]
MRFFKGDVICTDFDPSRGHEQTKRRYAVVVSNNQYNTRCALTMICPITSNDNGYPLHFSMDELDARTVNGQRAVSGFVEVEQLKALDLNARNTAYIGKIPDRNVDTLTQAALSCLL